MARPATTHCAITRTGKAPKLSNRPFPLLSHPVFSTCFSLNPAGPPLFSLSLSLPPSLPPSLPSSSSFAIYLVSFSLLFSLYRPVIGMVYGKPFTLASFPFDSPSYPSTFPTIRRPTDFLTPLRPFFFTFSSSHLIPSTVPIRVASTFSSTLALDTVS
ncbi:hypothetical protein D8B26_004279 [Coccidioides posadasii str. Silveira]|uniref:uncharacterized protein n=1 Tax=Coccidioides posadasii (strain RMSCC 757 / Silveira) TaxID=443226 RepID=UPI001BF1526D|nr:hypothetical protein D8B26_004279 [Coccidioides posadasii str. Silveira]